MLSFQTELRLSPASGCRFPLYSVCSNTTRLGVTAGGSDPYVSGNSQMCDGPGKQEVEILRAEKQELGSTVRNPLTGEHPVGSTRVSWLWTHGGRG